MFVQNDPINWVDPWEYLELSEQEIDSNDYTNQISVRYDTLLPTAQNHILEKQ